MQQAHPPLGRVNLGFYDLARERLGHLQPSLKPGKRGEVEPGTCSKDPKGRVSLAPLHRFPAPRFEVRPGAIIHTGLMLSMNALRRNHPG
jgi:hypothetical protein